VTITPGDLQRFWTKVARGPGGCLLWTAGKGNLGHGRFWHEGRLGGAHRFAWEATHGPIPAGLEIDHLCRRPSCVNVAHLEAVTPAVNSQRRSRDLVADRGGGCKHGHDASEYKRYEYAYGSFLMCRACMRDSAEKQRAKKRARTGTSP